MTGRNAGLALFGLLFLVGAIVLLCFGAYFLWLAVTESEDRRSSLAVAAITLVLGVNGLALAIFAAQYYEVAVSILKYSVPAFCVMILSAVGYSLTMTDE